MKERQNHYIDFSLVFYVHKPNDDFKPLEVKQCAVASEIPEFNEDDIFNRLQKLKVCKLPGPDMIHPRILYETAQQIAYPLKLIFETSFHEKKLPVEWKYANITPIYKKRFKVRCW